MGKIRIWDLPTRIFHWLLALAVTGAVVTQYIGGTAMLWHFRCGYLALSLVVFRLVWGLIGTTHARFASFVRPPRAIWAYLTGRAQPGAYGKRRYLGHNPLGALSVLAMLAAVLLQAGTGLFANDDISAEGPLAKFVAKEWSDRISAFHGDVGSVLIYLLVALHLVAIAYYRMRRGDNLLGPMVTGDKLASTFEAQVSDGTPVRVRGLVCMLLSAGSVALLVSL